MQSQKWQNDLCSFPRQTIQYNSNPSLCPNQKCWITWSGMVLWRPTWRPRTDTKKDVLFIIGDWNARIGSQEIPGVIGIFGLGIQNEAGQGLTEFCQENALVGSSCSKRDSQESSPTPQFKSINSSEVSFLYGPTLKSVHDYWKNHSFD